MPRPSISRREFLSTAAVAAGLPVVAGSARSVLAATQVARFTPPTSPRSRINFNLNWRFIREDVSGAKVPEFDDSQWAIISTPHSSTTLTLSGRSAPTAAAISARTRDLSGIAGTSSFQPVSQDAKSFSNSRACVRRAISTSMGNWLAYMKAESPLTELTSLLQ